MPDVAVRGSTPNRTFVICLLAGMGVLAAVSLWKPNGRSTQTTPLPLGLTTQGELDRLREKFPVRKLAGRLAYERSSRSAAESPVELDEFLEAQDSTYNGSTRATALGWLHERLEREFAAALEQGAARLVPGPEHLEFDEPGPLTLAALEPNSISLLLPEDDLSRRENLLQDWHRHHIAFFISPDSVGVPLGNQTAIGFVSHASIRPQFPESENQTPPKHARWTISRMELVSLLVFTEPRVYVSDELPRIRRGKKPVTRPLRAFEANALQKMASGHHIVWQRRNARSITMVGALRASKKCQSCHDVAYGSLLGAFSYDLTTARPTEIR